MGWKWEFHGVEVAERRNLSAQGVAGFATFGGGFLVAGNGPFGGGKWPIWGWEMGHLGMEKDAFLLVFGGFGGKNGLESDQK